MNLTARIVRFAAACIKRAADATLSYTLSDVVICAYDHNLFPPTFGTDDAHTQIRGAVLFSILAWTS
jgi:hypothetical protein